jgi:hypothetical protein
MAGKRKHVARAQVGTLIVLSLSLVGCSVVENVRPDGVGQRSIVVGAPIVVPSESGGLASVTHITGVGLAMVNNAAVLGWFDNSVLLLSGECRVVLVGNTEEQLKRFAALLPKNEGVCGGSTTKEGEK